MTSFLFFWDKRNWLLDIRKFIAKNLCVQRGDRIWHGKIKNYNLEKGDKCLKIVEDQISMCWNCNIQFSAEKKICSHDFIYLFISHLVVAHGSPVIHAKVTQTREKTMFHAYFTISHWQVTLGNVLSKMHKIHNVRGKQRVCLLQKFPKADLPSWILDDLSQKN